MTFDPILAEIRFGTGLSPTRAPPASADAMVTALHRPDLLAYTLPIPRFDEADPSLAELRQWRRRERQVRGTAREEQVREASREAFGAARTQRLRNLTMLLARAATTETGLRERLTLFWADHFTIRAKNALTQHLVTAYAETAIRPHLAGRFSALLRAAILHPLMLDYLDQTRSVGPNSPRGERTGQGLNENLARELIELHTLGAGADYSQRDVRELAELLTGLTWDHDETFLRYQPDRAEPGAETLLGRSFSPEARLSTITEALDALAAHPATARHICAKLAAHFVADTPDPALVAAMIGAWGESGGNLSAVMAAMLAHRAAWAPQRRKVRPPIGYIGAALRAMGIEAPQLAALDARAMQRLFAGPLAGMGQPWEQPIGPNGWPDEADAWINPQFLAARITWAMTVPALLGAVSDPRRFVQVALGPDVPDDLSLAAAAAPTRAAGLGLVLASPAFQRS